jgi:hypothetical protein
MSKIVSTVATLIACAEAAAIRSPENVAVQNGNVMGNSTLNALDNKARIADQGKQGTLLHWYARLGMTKVANFLAETTGLIGGCSSGSVSSTSSCSSQSQDSSYGSSCSSQGKDFRCVMSADKSGCTCSAQKAYAQYFFHPRLF